MSAHSLTTTELDFEAQHPPATGRRLALLTLTALGVVYGDIGTSPLYALRECFKAEYGIAPTHDNVVGVLSLIVWSLILVVSVKYIAFVLRADNRGEGGILALLALLLQQKRRTDEQGKRFALVALGLFGAALLVRRRDHHPGHLRSQRRRGARGRQPGARAPRRADHRRDPVRALHGPALRHGAGRGDVRPDHARLVRDDRRARLPVDRADALRAARVQSVVRRSQFFGNHGVAGFLTLGAVVLCITGCEALYADMGHFGKRPIRLAWFIAALPMLLLNYFGQGALVLRDNAAAENPFYLLAPAGFQWPLLVIATAAAIVASQALISGAYSLTQQSIQLGYSPRMQIVHTSEKQAGQIYIPEINKALMVGCLVLVLTFRNSSAPQRGIRHRGDRSDDDHVAAVRCRRAHAVGLVEAPGRRPRRRLPR